MNTRSNIKEPQNSNYKEKFKVGTEISVSAKSLLRLNPQYAEGFIVGSFYFY